MMDDQAVGYMVLGASLAISGALFSWLFRLASDQISSYAEARGWPDTTQGALGLLGVISVVGVAIFLYGFVLLWLQ